MAPYFIPTSFRRIAMIDTMSTIGCFVLSVILWEKLALKGSIAIVGLWGILSLIAIRDYYRITTGRFGTTAREIFILQRFYARSHQHVDSRLMRSLLLFTILALAVLAVTQGWLPWLEHR